MRTDAEILARISEIKADDFCGFETTDLLPYLSQDAAAPFIQENVTADVWENMKAKLKAPADEIRDYMAFAWGKANGCRGLSASRSISHMKAWLWLDGQDELVKQMDDLYEFYGKPCLVAICLKYGIDWKALDNGEWVNDEGETPLTADQALAKKGLTVL